MRAFAKKIGLSAGSLSDTFQGKSKWKLRPERAAEILEKVSIGSSVRNRLLAQMGKSPQFPKRNLAAADYEILTDWTYYPILFSFDLPAEGRQPKAIAKRLGLSEEKVGAVIEDLLRRELLVKAKNGEIGRPESVLKTTDGPPDEIIRQFHDMNLSLSRKALAEIPAEERDFASSTFVGNEKQISLLREEIRKLYEKASALMDDGENNTTVFRFSTQLFPMEFK
ncbi:MAG: TIGR02147 family protein [Bacteriovoracia bacterium]